MSSITNSPGSFFNRSLAQMADLRAGIERTRSQIATGRRIDRGSQDPAAAAQLRSVARREALAKIEDDNAARLVQDLGSGANELENITQLFQRARELAVQAVSSPTSEKGWQSIGFELEQLGIQLFTRANAVALTGEPLFAGQAAAGNVTYVGTPESGAIPIAPGAAIERGIPGDVIFEFDVNGTPTNAFKVIGDLAAAMQDPTIDRSAAARDALAGLDTALGSFGKAQTILGTRISWVEQVQTQQAERGIALASRRSRVGDTDVADAIAKLQQSLTALEATQAAFARVSSLTLFDALR
jgi:flagellar hook-associated protein 3 FlgL